MGLGLRLAVVLGETEEVLGLGHGLSAGGDGPGGFLGAFWKVWEKAAGGTGGRCGAHGGPHRTGAQSLSRDQGSLTVTGKLGRLRLRLGVGQGQVSWGVESLTHRLRILAVQLSKCRGSTNHFLVLVGTREVIQAKEVHLFGSPDVTAGQPCVSAEHRENLLLYITFKMLPTNVTFPVLYT